MYVINKVARTKMRETTPTAKMARFRCLRWEDVRSPSPPPCLLSRIVRLSTMDLSTTPRRATDGVGDIQKTRVAKSVFSIRSLVDVEEAELPAQDECSPSESYCWIISFRIIIIRYIHRWKQAVLILNRNKIFFINILKYINPKYIFIIKNFLERRFIILDILDIF